MSGRTHAAPLAPSIDHRDPDARIIYVVLALIGAVRVIVALALGETFGGEDTIAIAMLAAAVVGLVTRR